MKTDDLIAMLASGTNIRVPPKPVGRFISWMALGLTASIAIMLMTLGMRADFGGQIMMPAFWVKMSFVLSLTAAGYFACKRMAIPGQRITMLPILLFAPIGAIWLIALSVWLQATPVQRPQLFWGDTWQYCTTMIAILSLPVFTAILKIMRALAPTRLRWSGAIAGFTAGAVAMLVYSFHCPEIEAPFIGFWYVTGMLVPTAIGWLSGPLLLRW